MNWASRVSQAATNHRRWLRTTQPRGRRLLVQTRTWLAAGQGAGGYQPGLSQSGLNGQRTGPYLGKGGRLQPEWTVTHTACVLWHSPAPERARLPGSQTRRVHPRLKSSGTVRGDSVCMNRCQRVAGSRVLCARVCGCGAAGLGGQPCAGKRGSVKRMRALVSRDSYKAR